VPVAQTKPKKIKKLIFRSRISKPKAVTITIEVVKEIWGRYL
jgi:hypothetical protein